jgi:hypothetical protein
MPAFGWRRTSARRLASLPADSASAPNDPTVPKILRRSLVGPTLSVNDVNPRRKRRASIARAGRPASKVLERTTARTKFHELGLASPDRRGSKSAYQGLGTTKEEKQA